LKHVCANFGHETLYPTAPTEKAAHDKMVALVERMLAREIEATDAKIDKLVYEFYGLTEEPPPHK
jgi:hypothetical protein